MKLKMTCPFCGEDHCIVETKNGYHCTSCEYDFTDDDLEHEELRKKISCVCSAHYASEEKPIDCTKGFLLTIGDDEAMGLSELEKPQVSSIFHDNEGVVWIKMVGEEEPKEVDSLTTSDLKAILTWLEEDWEER